LKSVDIFRFCVDITEINVNNVVDNLGEIIQLKYYILLQFAVLQSCRLLNGSLRF
jgi:hypothetical protein